MRINKVLMFLKSVDRDERMMLIILLEDDNDTNKLIKNWEDVKWTCQQYDKPNMDTSLGQSRIIQGNSVLTDVM